MSKPSHLYWGTKDELRYLKNVGHHLTKGSGREVDDQELSRFELLQRYRDIMDYRVNWGEIDPVAILLHVTEEIRKEIHHG